MHKKTNNYVHIKRCLFFVFSLLILSTSSCSKNSLEPQKTENTLRIAFSYDPFSIDPRKCSDPVSCNLCFLLYTGLTHLNPDGSISLNIAKKIEVSKDLCTYTFHLKNTLWSNGETVSAFDFERSWKSILNPDFTSSSAYLLFPIKNAKSAKIGKTPIDQVGIHAQSDRLLIVTLEHPVPYFLELLAYCTYFPIHPSNINSQVQKNSIISSGPFNLTNWHYDKELSLQKNPSYFDKKKVFLEKIHISIIKEENTTLQMYENNALDLIGGFTSPITLDALEHLSLEGDLLHQPIGGTTFCTFNLTRLPLKNRNIRKGLALAIDRNLLVKNITPIGEQVATGIVPPILKNHGEHTSFFIDSQKNLAKKYFEKGLKELNLNIKDYPILTYSYFASDLQKKIALIIQSQWRETLGIHVKLQCFELKVFLDLLHRRHYDIAHMSLITQFPDQMNVLERFMDPSMKKNYCGFSNVEYTQLLQDSFFAKNAKSRDHLFQRAEEILMQEMPIAPLYHYTLFYLQNSKVKGLEISPLGHLQYQHVFLESLQ
ncbi:MAG: peptide ABC transporter substrate-binding protein [Simkaniaceae bacterium]|nr:peptide ABC transporter substrate-binding protein [Simkaniaceae bacterium]